MTDTNIEASASSSIVPLLEVKDLQVEFTSGKGKRKRTVNAVKGASLTVLPGQKVAIVGESGSGKSTTAHAVINLLPGSGKVTGGSIKFEGRELTGLSEKDFVDLRGSQIGLVPQDPMSNLNPVWKIGTQVAETLIANGATDENGKKLDKAGLKRRVAELLSDAGLPDAEARANQYPHEFSGGMRQRVLIAIGLANRPKLLIADEPTSALDVTVQKVILDHLDGLTRELGAAVLFITHDLGLAAERAEHLVVMYKGQVVESGPSVEILKDPQHPYTKKLIAAAPSLASTRMQSSKAAQKPEVYNEETKDLIVVENLVKEFPIRGKKEIFRAVSDVSFHVHRGKTTSIVGESGSGKSTVANMVLGLLPITSGSILFEKENITDIMSNNARLKAFRRRVQPVFQNPYGSLDPMFSIGRAIEEPLLIHNVGNKKEREARVRELLDLVKLPTSVITRYPNELSGGQRQRIAIARAIALNPDLVVLDEAVSALDVLVQQQVLTLLNDLQAELGLTYLFITHDLAVVRLVADEVLVMQNGSIVETGLTEDVFNNPKKPYTQNLLDAIPGRHIL